MSKKAWKTLAAVVAGIATAMVLSLLGGCGSGKANEPFKDAPKNGRDARPAMIVEMPDGFSNLATKCIEGTKIRVTVVFHGDHTYGAVSQVQDPSC